MKIVYLGPFAYTPKATVSARMLPMATALARRGHQVTILMPPYDNPADNGRAWSSDGVVLENVRTPDGLTGPRLYWAQAQRMAARARQLQPDLLHIFKPVGPGALAVHWLRDLPRVVDNDDWEGRGGWIDVNPFPTPLKLALAWQERWTLRQADAVTAASHALRERSQALMRRTALEDPIGVPKPLMLLPNGPDDRVREWVAAAAARRTDLRASFGWAPDDRVLIYSGTVPHGNDMDLAVRAVRAVSAEVPNTRWVIIATGGGVPGLRQAVADAGIQGLVEWHDFMPYREVLDHLAAADAALYPYRDSNINRAKCSGKVIDYMACALPMVVSDVGMNRDYVRDGESAFLAEPGNGEAFTSALLRIMLDPGAARVMGQAAQARLWSQFSWISRIVELERLYTAVAARRTSGRNGMPAMQ